LLKKGQTITLDLIIGITIFISTIVLFYYLFGIDVTQTEEEDAATKIVEGLNGNQYFQDGELTSDELIDLTEMDCAELKTFLNTNKNICIYATDHNGNLVELNNKYGVGCPGIDINELTCGENITVS
jgi:hypothetical protein